MDITKKIETILGKEVITEGKIKDFFKKMAGMALDVLDKKAINSIINFFDKDKASASQVYIEYTMQNKQVQKNLKASIGRWLKKNKHDKMKKLYELIQQGSK